MDRARVIRKCLSYAGQFKGAVMVIKIDREIDGIPEVVELVKDIRLLKASGSHIVLICQQGDVICQDPVLRAVTRQVRIEQLSIETIMSNEIPLIEHEEHDIDLFAARMTIDHGASKLIFVCPFDGIFAPDGRIMNHLDVSRAKDLLRSEEVTGNMSQKLVASIYACENGVRRVHIIGCNRRRDDSLIKELFSTEGVGTMICSDLYEEIRQAREEDIPGIVRLMGESDFYLPYSGNDLKKNLIRVFVYTLDQEIYGGLMVHLKDAGTTLDIDFLTASGTYDDFEVMKRLLDHLIALASRHAYSNKDADDGAGLFKRITLDIKIHPTWIVIHPFFQQAGFTQVGKIWVKNL